MGNTNSHGSSNTYSTSDTQPIPPAPHSWAYSYPRSQYFRPPAAAGSKVLPPHVPGQRLRPTENGSMLHNAGTITGHKRPYEFDHHHRLHPHHHQFQRGYEMQRHGPRDGRRDRVGYNMYASEPDLRLADSRQSQQAPQGYQCQQHNHGDNMTAAAAAKAGRMSRSKKKYRAPQAPPPSSYHHNGAGAYMESSSPDSYQHWENQRDNSRSSQNNGMPPRSRLFKTRAETTKRKVSKEESTKHAEHQPHALVAPQPGSNLHRSMSSPQFQAELKRVTERLRDKEFRHPPVGRASESSSSNPTSDERAATAADDDGGGEDTGKRRQTADGNSSSSNRQRLMADRAKRMSRSIPNLVTTAKRRDDDDEVRCTGEGSSAAGSNDERKGRDKSAGDVQKPSAPDTKPKTFYFGMNEFNDTAKTSRTSEDVDRFAQNFNKTNGSPSDSIASSDPTDESGGDISLQLRPTLPRKQFDIPRFSPTAAWRLLTALESPTPISPNCSGGEEDLIPIIDQPHNSGDKSGDSGISGDASPHSAHNSQVAWTPQQDLEETSSDGGMDSAPVSPQSLDTAQFSRTRTVARPSFCLSLPRDETTGLDRRYGQINEDFSPMNPPKSNGYFKSKLSRGRTPVERNKSRLDENWVLSRSVPDSLHHSGLVGNFPSQNWSQLQHQDGEEPDDEELALSSLPKFSYLAAGRRAMYLPEYKSLNYLYQKDGTNVPDNTANVSKSCEDLTRDNREDDDNQLPAINEKQTRQQNPTGKKFAFQSTIRQIERKKIAEKLSKEAEYKERQRLSEMDAMRRVEEEFQRKREREKADIRQQLRLYTLTQGDREPAQPLPSGTQVLSEFRESRRDYKDFSSSRVEHVEPPCGNRAETPAKKSTTVHPKVVYQMPKSTPVYVTPNAVRKQRNGPGPDGGGGKGATGTCAPTTSGGGSGGGNYRRDFAQGILPHSVASSDSEVSAPNTRPGSRTKHRSRSVSPVSDRENNDIEATLSYVNIIKSLRQQEHNEPKLNEVTSETIPTSSIVVGVNSLQPFVKNKNSMYKPIVFNPINNKNKFAQPLI